MLLAAPASGHLRFPKLAAERFIELRLDGERVVIDYKIGFGAVLADQERRQADRDGDFEVSTLESNARMDQRTEALLSKVRVCSGPTSEEVSCRALSKRDVARVQSEGWSVGPSRHLHITWTLELFERPARLGAFVLEDDYHVDGIDVTDVVVVPPSHTPLLAAGDPTATGASPVSREWTWLEARRPPGPRRVMAAWQPPSGHGGLLVGGGVLALAAVFFGLWLRHRPPSEVRSPR